LTGFVRQFVNQMCHPIGAEMSRQQAMGDLTRLRKLFLAGGRLAAGVAGLFGGVTLVLASPFLRIWTHGAVPDNLPLLTAFLVTAILLAPAQMAMVLFLYNNRPLALVLGNGGYAAGTALLCALLVKGYSAAGAAAGTGIAEFLFIGVLVTVIAARDVAVSAVRYIVLSTATAVAGFGVSLGIARALQGLMDEQTLAGLFLVGSLWAAAVALPAYFIVLHAEERRWVRTQASGVGRRVLLASGIRF
jgi:O-antigen/teichoic acid export membrane protein